MSRYERFIDPEESLRNRFSGTVFSSFSCLRIRILTTRYVPMLQTMKNFLILWLMFGVFMGAFFAFQHGPAVGIPSGIGSGFLFAAFMTAFAEYQARKFRGQCPLAEGETLVKEGPANHFVRVEGVGGWLYLTSQRLCFRSHKVNVQNHELSIPLSEIRSTKKSLTAGIIPNGLMVETANGSEKFVVNGSRGWVDAIELARSGRSSKREPSNI